MVVSPLLLAGAVDVGHYFRDHNQNIDVIPEEQKSPTISPSKTFNLLSLFVHPITVLALQYANFPYPLPFIIVFLAYRILYTLIDSQFFMIASCYEHQDSLLAFAQVHDSRIRLVGTTPLSKNILGCIDYQNNIFINSLYFPRLPLPYLKFLILHEIGHLTNTYGIAISPAVKPILIISKNIIILLVGVFLAFYSGNPLTLVGYLIFTLCLEDYLSFREEFTCDTYAYHQLVGIQT